MPLLGAHMSIAGGYYKAVEAAAAYGMDTCQVFTKNSNQWRARPITDEEADAFREALARHGIGHPVSHASYLINLASPDAVLWRRSVDAMVVELERAERLGIPFVVVHPGAAVGATERRAIGNVVRALKQILRRTARLQAGCLLENTAGQGSTLGWRFEQLAAMLDGVPHAERLGVCLDTCHAFAAGYPLSPRKNYRRTMQELDATVGLDNVRAVHLNDSARPLGSRVDRHAHIGSGQLGLEAFRLILRDRRFRCTPMYLETAKGTDASTGQEWDRQNLALLRKLAQQREPALT